MDTERLRATIEGAGERPAGEVADAVEQTIDLLDRGELRVAEPSGTGDAWVVHTWVKQAILLAFRQWSMEPVEVGPFEYHDKVPLKTGYAQAGVRVVPPAVVRRGAHIEPGAVLMPSYVNIGARVGSGSMVDTWATVGSCAQIGRDVHLAGGVGIGGVLEPPGARPVIVEDGAFVGSRCVVVEGMLVGAGAVLGAGTVLTPSMHIIDVTGEEPATTKGAVPPGAIVIPGTRPRAFPAGEYQVPCALVIGWRGEATDRKVSLEQALRDHDVPV